MKNILIIGAGRQGKEHINELLKLRKEKIINNLYVYDIDVQGIAEYCTSFNLLQLNSMDNLLSYNIDIGIICTPNIFHKGIIKILCSNGINILKEKPFGMDLKEGIFIKNLAIKNNLIIKCCQQREYNGLYDFIEENIGQLGQIKYINYEFTLNDSSNSWYWEKEKGGGALFGMSWHCLYFFAKFFGKPKEVNICKINGNKRSWIYDSDDSNSIDIKYEDGMICKIYTSVISPVKREIIEIHGEEGYLYIDRETCYLNIQGVEKNLTNIFKGGYKKQIISFINLINSKKLCIDELSLKTLKMINN